MFSILTFAHLVRGLVFDILGLAKYATVGKGMLRNSLTSLALKNLVTISS